MTSEVIFNIRRKRQINIHFFFFTPFLLFQMVDFFHCFPQQFPFVKLWLVLKLKVLCHVLNGIIFFSETNFYQAVIKFSTFNNFYLVNTCMVCFSAKLLQENCLPKNSFVIYSLLSAISIDIIEKI